MKNSILKLVVLNIILGIVILVVCYITGFLAGYGASNRTLLLEKKLFVKFVFVHLSINIFLLYKFKKFNFLGILVSVIVIAIIYLIAAWQYDYF